MYSTFVTPKEAMHIFVLVRLLMFCMYLKQKRYVTSSMLISDRVKFIINSQPYKARGRHTLLNGFRSVNALVVAGFNPNFEKQTIMPDRIESRSGI